jgi:RNA polymerase sigma-70 factor (ECF subfamily)
MGRIIGLPVRERELGSTTAFNALYRRHGRGLFGTARRMLGRAEDAEDVMQEAFITLFEKDPDLRAGEEGAWLHRVLVNRCIDRIRARKRRPEDSIDVPEGEPGPRLPGVPAGSSAERIDLPRAVDTLPERARLVFLLHDVEGFRHADVAGALGITEGSSKSQLFRARELLRARLGAGRPALRTLEGGRT